MVDATVALGITALTLAAFAAAGTWYARGRVSSVEDYISARDSAGGGTLTATLVASSMGAWILFSPAEAGAAFGGVTAVVGYALGSAVPLLGYAVLGPRIRRLIPEGHSLTEYAHARYGRAMYVYVLLVSGFYMFVFLAAEMTGVAGALGYVAGVPGWQTAALVGGFVLLYTGYGGLRASIFTDTLQTLVILPLLAVGFGGALVSLGGTGEIHRQVALADPNLLDPTFLAGLTFGGYVVVAILGAEMLNQAWWQRIYAARDRETLQRSFVVAAVAVVPMVLVAGLFGVAAVGLGLADGGNASIAFFVVVAEAFPEWVALAVVLLAVLLVMSTADTMFNALASIVTADLPRVLADPDERTLTAAARLVTAAVALGAVVVGAQGYSVLTLFLVADLLAVATFVPLLAGLYSPGVGGGGALAASVAGLAAGLGLFPPARALLGGTLGGVLPEPSFFAAFVGALAVSAGLTAVSTRLTGTSFDLGRLETEIRRLDEPRADGGETREVRE